jgi:hypothetical protein
LNSWRAAACPLATALQASSTASAAKAASLGRRECGSEGIVIIKGSALNSRAERL